MESQQQDNYRFLRKIGCKGSDDGELHEPYGVAIAPNGNIVVADTLNHRIQIFGPTGTLIRKFGAPEVIKTPELSSPPVTKDGEETKDTEYRPPAPVTNEEEIRLPAKDGELNFPMGVIIHPVDGNIIVVDTFNHRIQLFDSTGTYIRKFASEGSENGQIYFPGRAAIDTEGNVVVVDCSNHRLQVFDYNTGEFIRKFGSEGSGDGLFSNPFGVSMDRNGHILVCDTSNHRVQVFNPSTGGFVRKFGDYGSEEGQLQFPCGVAVDLNGNIIVASNDRIQLFDPEGKFIRKISAQGTGDGQVSLPYDVSIDSKGNIVVVERDNHRIQVFA